MKKSIVVLSMLLMAVFGAKAQEKNPQESNPNAPEVKFEKIVHDYGTINKDANGDCEFKFTNLGKEPLILSNVTSSCGCTVPSWPKEPILPGKSNSIKVHYATNRVGVINKQVTVKSNAKNDPVVLSIKGTVLDTPTDKAPEKKASDGTPAVK